MLARGISLRTIIAIVVAIAALCTNADRINGTVLFY